MSEGHAFLPPSSADVWRWCPMWPTMNARFPELEPTQESLEGSAAHWALALKLTTGREVEVSQVAPNGVTITEEMTEAVEVFDAAVEPLRGQTWHVEETVQGSPVHASLNWGTPDLWTFQFPFLDVVDFKFGHEYVEIYENMQLVNYALLILELLGISGATDQQITVRLHVVQPRSYTPEGTHRTWTVKASDLRAFRNILAGAADAALVPEPIAKPGPYCKHCPGRHACTMLQRVAQSAIVQSGHSLPVELPPEAVGLELRMLQSAAKMLAARITGLEEQATGLLKRGERVPGFAMESVASREVWGRPAAEVVALGTAMGVDLYKPGTITPKQAVDKGMPAELVAAYVAPRSNALKLVPANDSKARRVFGITNG